jgi:hypothetical protein
MSSLLELFSSGPTAAPTASRRHDLIAYSSCAPSCIECICSLLQRPEMESPHGVRCLPSLDMQRLALALCQCAAANDTEQVIPAAAAMGILGQIDCKRREDEYSHGRGYVGVFDPKINALFSNALLRAIESSKTTYEAATKGSRAAINRGVNSSALRYHLDLLNTAISAFIDLHTSDDSELLKIFSRLDAPRKLGLALHDMESVASLFNSLRDRDKTKKDTSMQTDDDDDGNISCSGDSEDDSDVDSDPDYMETLENLTNFIEYKSRAS